MMGSFYYNGYGVEKDLKKARRYFYEAARWDLPNSQFKLGIMMAPLIISMQSILCGN